MQDKKIADIAQELYARNAELLEVNRILTLIQDIETLVLAKGGTVDEHIDSIVQKVINEAEVSLFSVVIFDKRELVYRSLGLFNPQSLSFEKMDFQFQDKFPPENLLLAESGVDATNKYKVGDIIKGSENDLDLNIIQIRITDSLSCALLFAEHNNHLTSFQGHLMTRLADFIGTILGNIILTDQLSLVSKGLKRSNEKLKALDEAKDEFVSMASHQLRTPLTSIKGYISMVLEGDAGKITDIQKQMLGQAFFSSQRMVYLISDLLNVSRLKTGKFVIEPKPVYLPDVVESELSQLREGATAKNLTLSFVKPKEFPTISLDEMKTRQVIMNFTDNALYYTPTGGKITIELRDKGKSVEFTVKDTGIGVPKAEQHKLFAKFYRAENARKARPDGTGLGLFMAQKVIIAQGGSIIFNSKEGKGSTFGFSFPKAKLEVKPQETKPE